MNTQALKTIAGYALMASIILMPTVSLAKGNSGDDNGNVNGKVTVSATAHIENSNDSDNDTDSDSDSASHSNGNAFGHFIAPGWIKHNGGAPTNVSLTSLPSGISRLFESRHTGTTTSATSTTSAPTVLFVFSKPGATTATVSWFTNEPSSSQVSYGTTTSYAVTTTLNTSLRYYHTATITGLASSTTYHYEVMSTNSSGMTGTSSDKTFTTTGISIKPILSNIQVSGVGSTTATVSWTTNEPASSNVFFGTSSPLNFATSSFVADTNLVINHILQLGALVANTLYTIVIQSTDSFGNVATSSAQSFTTLP